MKTKCEIISEYVQKRCEMILIYADDHIGYELGSVRSGLDWLGLDQKKKKTATTIDFVQHLVLNCFVGSDMIFQLS